MRNKDNIRKEMLLKRRNMDRAEVSGKSEKALDAFFSSDIYKKAQVIMFYLPLGNEVDTTAMTKRILNDKKRAVLPVTDVEKNDIIPVEISENTVYKTGAYKIKEPEKITDTDKNEIDVVVVPGVAFGKNGERIGFGKGYYDRFLKNMDCIKMGLCYEYQIEENFSSEKFDVNMDCLITESGLIDCE